MIRTLFISAGLATMIGLPCHAQLLGVQGGLSGSVNPPLGASVAGTVQGSVNPSTAEITDGRAVNPGTASTNASARVSSTDAAASAGVTGGMIIRDMGGLSLGRVVSVAKNSAGQVAGFVIETDDGVRRSMPAGGLTVKAGAAATTQSEADLVALPQVR